MHSFCFPEKVLTFGEMPYNVFAGASFVPSYRLLLTFINLDVFACLFCFSFLCVYGGDCGGS